MAATLQDLTRWFLRGFEEEATHMIVVCDTYDREDYPVYVSAEEDPREVAAEFDGKNMQKLMEVYNLKKKGFTKK